VIEGVLYGSLRWGLVGTASALSIFAIIAGLPGLSFAIGIYLPSAPSRQSSSAASCDAWSTRKGTANQRTAIPGVLAASGTIASAGLVGVLIAFLMIVRKVPRPRQRADEHAFHHEGLHSPHRLRRDRRRILIVIPICVLRYRAGLSAHVEATGAVKTSVSA
jgi:hypothetical protein